MPTTTSPPRPLPVKHTTTTPNNIINAVQHAATGTINYTQIVLIIVGVLILVAIVSIIAYAIIRGRAGKKKYSASEKLDRALSEGDAVGIILDLETHKGDIVPLRRVQGYYYSLDPKSMVIVTANPYAHMFMVHGKPLVIAPGSGRTAMQGDPVVFTKLGLAQVAIKDPLWHSNMNPHKALELLIEKLMTSLGRQVGELQLTHNVKLGFEMSPPDIILSLLQENIRMNEMLISGAVNFYETADRLSKILKEHQLKEMELKQKWLLYILMGVTMIGLIGAIAWYIIHMGH